jgi:hypothetical protein
MHTLLSTGLNAAASALSHAAALRWQGVLNAPRTHVWSVAVAVALAVTLLVAFQRVVANSAELAERQRASASAQHDATWRCKMLRRPGERTSCLAQVADAHESAAPGRQRTFAAMGAASIEPSGRYAVVGLPSLVQPLE